MLNQHVNITDFVRFVTSDISAARGNREAELMKHTTLPMVVAVIMIM